MNRSRMFDEITRDVAFAVRLLRRRPLFAALAIFTIALGIGAATSIFSVVDRVLLRALPFSDPSRLVAVWIAQPSLKNDPVIARLASRTVLGAEEFYALREGATSFKSIALWTRRFGDARRADVDGTSRRRSSNRITARRTWRTRRARPRIRAR